MSKETNLPAAFITHQQRTKKEQRPRILVATWNALSEADQESWRAKDAAAKDAKAGSTPAVGYSGAESPGGAVAKPDYLGGASESGATITSSAKLQGVSPIDSSGHVSAAASEAASMVPSEVSSVMQTPRSEHEVLSGAPSRSDTPKNENTSVKEGERDAAIDLVRSEASKDLTRTPPSLNIPASSASMPAAAAPLASVPGLGPLPAIAPTTEMGSPPLRDIVKKAMQSFNVARLTLDSCMMSGISGDQLNDAQRNFGIQLTEIAALRETHREQLDKVLAPLYKLRSVYDVAQEGSDDESKADDTLYSNLKAKENELKYFEEMAKAVETYKDGYHAPSLLADAAAVPLLYARSSRRGSAAGIATQSRRPSVVNTAAPLDRDRADTARDSVASASAPVDVDGVKTWYNHCQPHNYTVTAIIKYLQPGGDLDLDANTWDSASRITNPVRTKLLEVLNVAAQQNPYAQGEALNKLVTNIYPELGRLLPQADSVGAVSDSQLDHFSPDSLPVMQLGPEETQQHSNPQSSGMALGPKSASAGLEPPVDPASISISVDPSVRALASSVPKPLSKPASVQDLQNLDIQKRRAALEGSKDGPEEQETESSDSDAESSTSAASSAAASSNAPDAPPFSLLEWKNASEKGRIDVFNKLCLQTEPNKVSGGKNKNVEDVPFVKEYRAAHALLQRCIDALGLLDGSNAEPNAEVLSERDDDLVKLANVTKKFLRDKKLDANQSGTENAMVKALQTFVKDTERLNQDLKEAQKVLDNKVKAHEDEKARVEKLNAATLEVLAVGKRKMTVELSKMIEGLKTRDNHIQLRNQLLSSLNSQSSTSDALDFFITSANEGGAFPQKDDIKAVLIAANDAAHIKPERRATLHDKFLRMGGVESEVPALQVQGQAAGGGKPVARSAAASVSKAAPQTRSTPTIARRASLLMQSQSQAATSPPHAQKPDKSWYGYEEIAALLQSALPSATVLNPGLDGANLSTIVTNGINGVNKTFIIPLNINSKTHNFATGDGDGDDRPNHWVGLYVTTGDDGRINRASYIDPKGDKTHKMLSAIIISTLGIAPTNITEGKAIQGEGNDYDCGPMLVYLCQNLANGTFDTTVRSLPFKESVTLGQELRAEHRPQRYQLATCAASLESSSSASAAKGRDDPKTHTHTLLELEPQAVGANSIPAPSASDEDGWLKEGEMSATPHIKGKAAAVADSIARNNGILDYNTTMPNLLDAIKNGRSEDVTAILAAVKKPEGLYRMMFELMKQKTVMGRGHRVHKMDEPKRKAYIAQLHARAIQLGGMEYQKAKEHMDGVGVAVATPQVMPRSSLLAQSSHQTPAAVHTPNPGAAPAKKAATNLSEKQKKVIAQVTALMEDAQASSNALYGDKPDAVSGDIDKALKALAMSSLGLLRTQLMNPTVSMEQIKSPITASLRHMEAIRANAAKAKTAAEATDISKTSAQKSIDAINATADRAEVLYGALNKMVAEKISGRSIEALATEFAAPKAPEKPKVQNSASAAGPAQPKDQGDSAYTVVEFNILRPKLELGNCWDEPRIVPTIVQAAKNVGSQVLGKTASGTITSFTLAARNGDKTLQQRGLGNQHIVKALRTALAKCKDEGVTMNNETIKALSDIAHYLSLDQTGRIAADAEEVRKAAAEVDAVHKPKKPSNALGARLAGLFGGGGEGGGGGMVLGGSRDPGLAPNVPPANPSAPPPPPPLPGGGGGPPPPAPALPDQGVMALGPPANAPGLPNASGVPVDSPMRLGPPPPPPPPPPAPPKAPPPPGGPSHSSSLKDMSEQSKELAKDIAKRAGSFVAKPQEQSVFSRFKEKLGISSNKSGKKTDKPQGRS